MFDFWGAMWATEKNVMTLFKPSYIHDYLKNPQLEQLPSYDPL